MEYLAFMPSSPLSAEFEHHCHFGLHFFFTPNFQFDIPAAVGLNSASENLAFTCVGLSWKY
jgi:hypothetical protein